jgi:hypothetical protein
MVAEKQQRFWLKDLSSLAGKRVWLLFLLAVPILVISFVYLFAPAGEDDQSLLWKIRNSRYEVYAYYYSATFVTGDSFLQIRYRDLSDRWKGVGRLFSSKSHHSASADFLDSVTLRVFLLRAVPGTYPREFAVKDTILVDLSNPPPKEKIERWYDLD